MQLLKSNQLSEKDVKKLSPAKNNSIIHNLLQRIILLEQKIKEINSVQKIRICTKDLVHYIDLVDILYLNSESNYTYIHLINGKKILVSKTLKILTERINHIAFLRIHSSYYINANYLSKYIKSESKVILKGSIELPVSRGKKHLIARWLDK